MRGNRIEIAGSIKGVDSPRIYTKDVIDNIKGVASGISNLQTWRVTRKLASWMDVS